MKGMRKRFEEVVGVEEVEEVGRLLRLLKSKM
jgi:hypothetical protein